MIRYIYMVVGGWGGKGREKKEKGKNTENRLGKNANDIKW